MMKSQLAGTKAALSLQEELVAAIHGAFEVAVEIAVREVKKLLGEAPGDNYDEMRRENESLRQRLQRAEAMLEVERDGVRTPIPKKHHTEKKRLLHVSQTRPESRGVNLHGDGGEAPSAGHSRAQRRPDPPDKHTCRPEGRTRHERDAAAEPGEEPGSGSRDIPPVTPPGCAVKVENRSSQMYQDPAAQHQPSPPLPHSSEHVTVKQETPEEDLCLDGVKGEDFNLECLSAAQADMLEQWKSAVPDVQRQDPNTCRRLEPAHSSDLLMPPGLPAATDLPSLSSDLSVFQLGEPATRSELPPQVYGVHVRIRRANSHNINSYYSCKSCSQSFTLPSLLRRHYGQCQQKRCPQPVVGGKRTRLQLYPPGCSPFRCTECNREFNRMENLKTHLRIHTGERPYTCSVCAKCFRHSGALTRHFRIHTGEKPYVCGQCGKSFRNCGGLKFHERAHSRQLQ